MYNRKPLHGIGINDSKVTTIMKDGSRCEAYMKWKAMVNRVYGKKALERNHNYFTTLCSQHFLTFSNFKAWYDKQVGAYEKGFELDKDLLLKGCKVYSVETCILLPKEINSFIIRRCKDRQDKLPIGVSFHKQTRKFKAQINVGGKRTTLGTFTNPADAFWCYKQEKQKQAKDLAEKWKDKIDVRAYEALMNYKIDIGD